MMYPVIIDGSQSSVYGGVVCQREYQKTRETVHELLLHLDYAQRESKVEFNDFKSGTGLCTILVL